MKNRVVTILNYSMVFTYTAALVLISALVEALFVIFKVASPAGLNNISLGLAETGFSVTIIAVSILTVITNMSERRYFGIKAGEYLKFRRRKFAPGFYDNLVLIVLIGALQYAALAVDARFAAAVMFIEIIVLMVVQIRWGLGIAFFYYGKEREIRKFFLDELDANLAIVREETREDGKTKKGERAALAVGSRLDQLFAHTKNAASARESTELVQNLSMLTHVFKALLQPKHHVVWHNFETRLDYLLASLLVDKEQREYALNAIGNVLDIIFEAMDNEEMSDGIAKNCDFDNSRNTAYEMLTYADPKTLESMFAKQLFYKMEVVKIFGIESDKRKVLRYRHYTEQFAKSVKDSPYIAEVVDMISSSIVWLAPRCFADGRIGEAGFYTCILIEALTNEGVAFNGTAEALIEKYFGNTESIDDNDIKKQKSAYILMLIQKEALKIGSLPDMPPMDDADRKMGCEMSRLLGKEIAPPFDMSVCE